MSTTQSTTESTTTSTTTKPAAAQSSTSRWRARACAAAALTVFAVGALGACGPMENKTFKDDATVKTAVTAVRIEGKSDGFRVRGKQHLTAATVHREVTYRDKSKPDTPTYRVENNVLVLGGCPGHCSVDYTVDVPAGIPVTGSTTAGGLNFSTVGAVKVSATDGRIVVNGATGPVDLRTTNGSIEAKRLKGEKVTAHASNGSVTLAPDTAQDVTAQTANGSITVTAPPAPYHVVAQTQNGSKHLGIRDDPAAGHRLNLTTDNGGITLKTAK
ncbi:DUF4097 family beta strand repeat-containing protein [Streptomyces sp. Edi4]|uniref:DUF4097 family beta strand repeat-containing protein n=1 Tax=Streptomyces sp. Edi4 TaxID=3162527 RepID=UPI003305ECA2